jgi:hypothetical protein
MAKPTDLVQGTLALLILRTLALQPMHGWGIAQRIRQVSKEVLQVNQGALSSEQPRCQSSIPMGSVGRVGKQSPRQVLFADPGRREISAPRTSAVEAAIIGD